MTLPQDEGQEPGPAQPVRVTPGFLLFMGLMLLPAVAALGVYFGAWLVADEVKTAEASSPSSVGDFAAEDEAVAGWKRALVGVCPLH